MTEHIASRTAPAMRKVDWEVAERTAAQLNRYYAERGEKINARVGPDGSIVSDLTAKRALPAPRVLPPKMRRRKGRVSVKERLLKFFWDRPTEWFRPRDLMGLVEVNHGSGHVALSQLHADKWLIKRRVTDEDQGVEYTINPERKSR